MTALIIIYGLILIVFLFAISNLSDRVDELKKQVRQQEHHINHNRIVIEMLGEEVYDKE